MAHIVGRPRQCRRLVLIPQSGTLRSVQDRSHSESASVASDDTESLDGEGSVVSGEEEPFSPAEPDPVVAGNDQRREGGGVSYVAMLLCNPPRGGDVHKGSWPTISFKEDGDLLPPAKETSLTEARRRIAATCRTCTLSGANG